MALIIILHNLNGIKRSFSSIPYMVLDPTRRYTWNTSFSHCTRFSDDIILVDSSPFDSFLMIITD